MAAKTKARLWDAEARQESIKKKEEKDLVSMPQVQSKGLPPRHATVKAMPELHSCLEALRKRLQEEKDIASRTRTQGTSQ